ncbi:alpha/beta fold hydrolase, partial [Streptomyces broussonetiae]|uniref:alpha/beta fold hydrolase n=1 Tax=Streptomyces broussonetiae TaxID=2686304 RepID=UPI0035D94B86
GTRLHYIDHGPATGPVVVFVASAYVGHEMWEYQTLPLAEAGFRCVALDRRGHGRSDDVWSGYDLDTLADDVNGLLDHLDLRGITLVGHSVGTAEVIRCVTRHGTARVDRVALVAGVSPGVVRTPRLPEGIAPADLRADEELFRRDRAAYYTRLADAFFALQFPENEVSPAYVRYMVDLCLSAEPRAATAVRAVVAELDIADELAGLELPVLVVHGTDDASAPLALTGERAARLAPDGVLKVYERAGHGLFATHAARLTADLREFAEAGAARPVEPAEAGAR